MSACEPASRSNADPFPPALPVHSRHRKVGWSVLKLGGTSMASAAAVGNALSVVADRVGATPPCAERIAVVTSALAGVTDLLVRWVSRRPCSTSSDREVLAQLRERYCEHLGRLAWGDPERLAATRIGLLLHRVARLADQHAELNAASRIEILASGERMAAVVFWAALASRGLAAQVVDAGELLTARGPAEDARPNVADSRHRSAIRLGRGGPRRLVMPGFCARGARGELKLLGRGGSDTAAVLLGAALGARRVEIWTDVAGVYPGDPRRHPELEPFSTLSFDAAEDLARAGAKVLHPRSMAPAREAGIPVWVRHAERLELPGTRIGEAP